MHASYRGLSYKSALDVWSSCVRLCLIVWTVDVVAACKAFQVAREAVRIRNSTIAVTVVLDSRYHSGATSVLCLKLYATSRETETSIPTTLRNYERPRYPAIVLFSSSYCSRFQSMNIFCVTR